MEPRIEITNEKKLVGKRLTMSLAEYKIRELWTGFTPRRQEIRKTLTNDLISLAVYGPTHFSDFNPKKQFERWAAVEVSSFEDVPGDMETFVLPSGLYAVFEYKGLNTDHRIFDYILRTWLPASKYELDDRPHFEVLGARYKNNDPSSEEEIWIPIKPR